MDTTGWLTHWITKLLSDSTHGYIIKIVNKINWRVLRSIISWMFDRQLHYWLTSIDKFKMVKRTNSISAPLNHQDGDRINLVADLYGSMCVAKSGLYI
ncbi:hypothetical protein SAY86_002996 [Trapa natans]|uniref:Uncharacterized protein n=1 Tax=Trapa natans TaxID=22666 RepID=A0AAN7LUM5_TRANT|nr:hypothetical protein SAY86_002996 [Trapa natans]